ncbi:MAG: Hsp70 family protein [Chloroflexi bacterium]|nr:Hsp70 family protein [Chloroflexota bacterium]
MRIGVDFGTTHTSAAYVQGGQVHFIPLDAANDDPTLLRSMVYINRNHEVLLGREAVETYLREDTGRIVRYEDKVVGTLENTVAQVSREPGEADGPITIIYDVVVAEDISTNGRLIQSIKTALRDVGYDGTTIYGRFYPLPELIALLLRHVRQQAEAHLGQSVTAVTLGRPVVFTADPTEDARAEARLRHAAELAGFTDICFEREPIAAALFYTHTLAQPETIFVFDFGGGTLDMTLMEVDAARPPRILATQGVLVGGDDLDSAFMMGKVAPDLGIHAAIDGDGSPFPHQMANLLRHWQTIPQLSRPQYLPIIRRAKQFGDAPEGFAALETVVTQNYGFQLFEGVERCKRLLSLYEATTMEIVGDGAWGMSLPATRREFQRAIVQEVAAVQKGLTAVLAGAEVAPNRVETVVTTGGSSLIPIFQTVLRNRFPEARLVHSDTFGSVTAGLAIAAGAMASSLHESQSSQT